jgi:single-strand DNA-binding protein
MINKVILVGNVGKDPEVRYIDNDLPVATFSLATSENYKDKNGQWQTKTEWHNIVAWRNIAKQVEDRVKKGSQLYIEGKLTTRSWEDKNGGGTRYTTEIVANIIRILGRRDDNNTSQNTTTASPEPETKVQDSPVIEDAPTDDLPF